MTSRGGVLPLLCLWAVGAAGVAAGCSDESGPLDFVAGGASSTTASDAAAGAAGNAGSATLPDSGAAPVMGDAGYGPLDGGTCLPGVPRCHGDFGYQMCEQDGNWGPPHSCAGYSSNGTSSYCVTTPGTETSEPWAACVDPACWYWINNGFIPGNTKVGICTSSTEMRRCTTGGTLDNDTCDGVCTQVGTLDGRALGFCEAQCSDGARECLGGAYYRECAGGRWLPQVQSCAEGASCNPLGTGAVPAIRCGGDCDAGTSRCAADAASIEVCSEAGQWEAGQVCLLGRCKPAGPQAQCQTECSADSFQCAFDGASGARACDEQLLWQDENACDADTTCRTSGGSSLGCLQCVGPGHAAGNAFGLSDSRCADAGVESCGEDDLWGDPVACPDGEVCVELTQGASTVAHCQPE